MTGIQREAMLKEGLTGLLNTYSKAKERGIWKFYHAKEQEKHLQQAAFHGSLFAEDIEGLHDFIGQADNLSYGD